MISEDKEIIERAEKMAQYRLKNFKNICVSVSGGSDSDLIIQMIEDNKQEGNNINYIFCNTGFEYMATKLHIKYLELKYNIVIEELRPKKPIPLAVKEHGVPFISKHVSDMISRLQRHNFKWEDKSFDELYKEYPKCKCALLWWCNKHPEGSMFNINRNKYLKEFLIINKPSFAISEKCCFYNKKDVVHKYFKNNNIHLDVTGLRKAEGGKRAANIKSCFDLKVNGVYSFRPIFWFKDSTKKEYENIKNITHSECYSKYGLKRTGCAGCPFGNDWKGELKIIEQYEPKLYKAVISVFGKSYNYMQEYKKFRKELETNNI